MATDWNLMYIPATFQYYISTGKFRSNVGKQASCHILCNKPLLIAGFSRHTLVRK